MGEIIVEILKFFAYITGEIILSAITLGRHKPSLPYEGKESMMTRELHASLSTLLGVVFWGAVLVLIAWLVSK